MYPAKWFFRKREEEPTTEVAIRRRIAEDVYIVLPAFDLKDQSASLHVVVNPLVNWIWFGFGVMAIGTGIALLPERAYSFAVAHAPEGTATSTVALLLVGADRAAAGRTGARAAFRHAAGIDRRAHATGAQDRRQAGVLVRRVRAAAGRAPACVRTARRYAIR